MLIDDYLVVDLADLAYQSAPWRPSLLPQIEE